MSNLKVGLQLYSVRDKMEQDMDATLKAVKEMGYDYVEFAGYFGKTAEEVRAILDKYDLKCVSVHQKYDVFVTDPEASVQYLKTIGAEFCAIPWMGMESQKGSENHDKAVAEIKQVAKLLMGNGIKLLYHNHDFEFEKYEDKFLLDWLWEEIGLDNMTPEIDTCWVKYAGYDPCQYLGKFNGLIDIVHLKDFTCKNFAGGPAYALIDASGKETKKPTREENAFKFMCVGEGLQDFPAILKASEEAGASYVIVEKDQWYDGDSLEHAKKSRDYLKTLGI